MKTAKSIPLDEQIVAVLTQPSDSATVAGVLEQARATLADHTRQADAADLESLNPLSTAAQARERRARAADYRFEADRMEASVSALESRLSELRDAEQDAREQAANAAALKERDELAAEIAAEYPRIVRRLTEFVQRIHQSDEHLKRLRLNDPSAEAVARDVPGSFYQNCSPIHRLADVVLPMPSGNRMAWEGTMSGRVYRGLEIELPEGGDK